MGADFHHPLHLAMEYSTLLASWIAADAPLASALTTQMATSEAVAAGPSTTTHVPPQPLMAAGLSSLEDDPMEYDEDEITGEIKKVMSVTQPHF